MGKPLQSLKAIKAHRGFSSNSKPVGQKSCARGPDGKRNATVDALRAEGYPFFTEAPQQPSTAAGSRTGRGSRGGGPLSSRGAGRGSGRGSGGTGSRGNKSAASKAADKARLAALMAVRKEVERAGGSWDPVRGCARVESPAVSDEDEVECVGESSRAEAEAARAAAGRDAAVDLDGDDDA